MGHLDGRVAIVTGDGRVRGIGRPTAIALASEGSDVVVTGTGRDPASYPDDEKQAGWKDVESTAQQIGERGRRALTWVGDVSRAASVKDLVDRVMAAFGRIDVLVNNAAYPRGNDRVPVTELDETVWHRVLEIKLTGAFLLAKRIVPIMVEQRMAQQAAIGQDLLEFMDALALRPAALAGYDWGGRAACIAAILAPARVRALVTIGEI